MKRIVLLLFALLGLLSGQTSTQAIVQPNNVVQTVVVGDLTDLVGRALNWPLVSIELTLQNCPGYKTINAKATADKTGKIAFQVPGNETLGCTASYYVLDVYENKIKVFERVYYIHGEYWDLNKNTFNYTGVSNTNIMTVGGVAKIPLLSMDKISKKILGVVEVDPILRYVHIDPYDRLGTGTQFQMFDPVSSPVITGGELPQFAVGGSLINSGIFTRDVVLGRTTLVTPGAVPFVTSSGILGTDDQGLVYDPVHKRLGIGTNNPRYAVEVNGDVAFTGSLVALSVHAQTISGNLSGNAVTASRLAGIPRACDANEFSLAVDAEGNALCSSIPNSATTADSNNTPTAIVTRDANGDFTARNITASFIGNLTGNISGTSKTITDPLLGDVTGSIAATVVSKVGGKTSTALAGATTTVEGASNLNVFSALVKRDASGNFQAGIITAAFIGNVTGSVSGTSKNITDNLAGDVTGPTSATVVGTVGGKTAVAVAQSVSDTQAATTSGTNNTIVKRDNTNTAILSIIGNASGSAKTITDNLLGDITGPVAATVVSTVGGKTAAVVASAVTTVQAATSVATPSTLMMRDASGNVSANQITTNNLIGNTTGLHTGNVTGSAKTITDALVGDVTGFVTATVVSTVGGSSAANVHTAEQTANTATSANTNSAVVRRDASGGFSAATITATSFVGPLTGNASTVTNGLYSIGSYGDPAWLTSLSGAKITGNIPGYAAGITGNLTGDVTSSGMATTVALVGGKTASAVATATITVEGATSADSTSTLVKRDAGGAAILKALTLTNTGNGTADSALTIGGLTLDSQWSNYAAINAGLGETAGAIKYLTAPANKVGRLSLQDGTLVFSNGTSSGQGQAASLTNRFSVDANGNVTAVSFVGNVTGSSKTMTDSLVGDVTGPVTATVVGLVGGSSAANVHTAEQIANTATSASTNNAVVRRDASGNFSAGTITATLNGNASTVTNGLYSTGSYADPAWLTSLSGAKISGNIPGYAAGITGNLTGDVTSIGMTTVVALVGGKTASTVATAVTTVQAATTAATPSTLVMRDAGGNVPGNITGSAATFTGSLGGDVTGTQSATVVAQVGGASAANIADAVTKRHVQNTDTGTTSQTFQLGGGVKLKNNSGVFEVRNAADNDWADITIRNLIVQGTTTTVNSTVVNIADNIITLNSNFTTGAPVSNGGVQVLRGSQTTASLIWDEGTQLWKGGLAGSEVAFSLAGHTHTLSGDVTGTVTGATTVALVGGSSAANVHAAELLANAATYLNTASAIVRRDSNGDFVTRNVNFANSGILGSVSEGSWVGNGLGMLLGSGSGGSIVMSGAAMYLGIESSSTVIATSLTLTRTTAAFVSPVTAPSFSGSLTGNVTGNVSGTAATFTGSLTGDVTSSGMATTVALVGGSTAALVHAAELLANAATANNTVSAIVRRDGSGGFAGGIITGIVHAASDTAGGYLRIQNTSQTTDNKIWDIWASGSQLVFRTVNDAYSAGNPWLTVSRSGATSTGVTFGVGVTATAFAGPLTGNVTGSVSGTAASFTGNLTGDVTSAGMATTVALVGGSAAALVHSAELRANAATNLNTNSTVVMRDSSGNFSAGTITAALNGNASTVTNGLYSSSIYADPAWLTSLAGGKVSGNIPGNAVGITGNLTGDVTSTGMVTVVALVGGSTAALVHSAELRSNAATNLNTVSTIVMRDSSGNFTAGTITATSFVGALTGNASTVTNGLYSTGSYADPAWLTSLAGAKISGNITGNAGTATALAAAPSLCSGNNWARGISANGTPTCNQVDFNNLSGTATAAQLPATITPTYLQMPNAVAEKILLAGIAPNTASNEAIGVESNTTYYQANTAHRWYLNHLPDGGTSDKMELTATGLSLTGTITAAGGTMSDHLTLADTKRLYLGTTNQYALVNDSGATWAYGGNGTTATIVLATTLNWDTSLNFGYTPGTVGAGAGVLTIGQITKNNTNFTHGVTVFNVQGTEKARFSSTGLTLSGLNGNGLSMNGTNPQITSNGNLFASATNNIYLRPSSSYGVLIDSGNGLAVTSGHVLIGTSLDSGYPLDVVGNGRVSAYLSTGSGVSYTGGAGWVLRASAASNYSGMYWDGSNNTELHAPGSLRMMIANTQIASVTASGMSVSGTVAANPGGNVPVCQKYTVDRTALTAAATSQSVKIFTLPAKSKMVGMSVKHSAAFAGTGITGMSVSVGNTGTPMLFTEAFDVLQAVSNTAFQDTSMFKSGSYIADDVYVWFTSAGGNVNAATAGSVDVQACWVTLQ